MPTKLTWIVMMAVLLVATITALNAFPSQPDDEPSFTLREVMEAMINKRCAHSNIISTVAPTKASTESTKTVILE
jgi:hypothetical protein